MRRSSARRRPARVAMYGRLRFPSGNPMEHMLSECGLHALESTRGTGCRR